MITYIYICRKNKTTLAEGGSAGRRRRRRMCIGVKDNK